MRESAFDPKPTSGYAAATRTLRDKDSNIKFRRTKRPLLSLCVKLGIKEVKD